MEERALTISSNESGIAASIAREQSEIQAMVISAKKFPRDETQSIIKVKKEFERPGVAESAQYSFPRGGTTIKGPSVDCARAIARCWGNISCGSRIVSMDEEYCHVKGFALDLETNTKQEIEAKFRKLVQRKVTLPDGSKTTKWVAPDERDLRELINKQCAICERNAILKIVPSDIVDDACEIATKTLTAKIKNDLKVSREDTIRSIVMAFDTLGIDKAMLEAYLGSDLKLIDEDRIVELRGIHKSIRDGNSKRADYFTAAKDPAAPDEVAAKLKAAVNVAPETTEIKEPEAVTMTPEEREEFDALYGKQQGLAIEQSAAVSKPEKKRKPALIED